MSNPSWGPSRGFVMAALAATGVATMAGGTAALLWVTGPHSGSTSMGSTGRRVPRTRVQKTAAPTATNPPSPNASRPSGDPEQVAAAFTTAFLTFRWNDVDGPRRRCRPWDTDAVDAALAGSWVPRDRDRRVANRETDDVAIHAVSPQDWAADHLDVSVAAVVTVTRPGRPTQVMSEFLDLRVTATPVGWAVDQVSQ